MSLPEIPEFEVWRSDGQFHGRHRRTRRLIHADTIDGLERAAAAVRIAATWRAAWAAAGVQR